VNVLEFVGDCCPVPAVRDVAWLNGMELLRGGRAIGFRTADGENRESLPPTNTLFAQGVRLFSAFGGPLALLGRSASVAPTVSAVPLRKR